MKLLSYFYDSENNKKISLVAIAFIYFLFGAVLLFLRNPDPFINPVIYAEDGTWSALALREGWWHALINSRSDYFVFINTIILFLASKISILFSGNPLTLLPQAIAVVSFSFFSGVATFAFITVRQISSSVLGGIAFLAVLLIPLGATQNEIIGRALQVGFYMPIISVFLLFWRNIVTGLYKTTLIDFFILLCAATNPFVFAVCFLYLSLGFFKRSSIKSFFLKNVSLVAPLLVLMFFLLPRMGGKGGVQQDFLVDNFIEALIARPIVYPFVFPWYQSFSDGLAIIGLFLFVAIVLFSYFKSRDNDSRFLILLSSLTIIFYSLATIVMRPGLTALLSNYSTTFPDRYFMGINVLVVFLFIVSVGQIIKDKYFKFFGMSILAAFSGLCLYWNSYIFEWSLSKYPIKSSLNFSEQLCVSEPIDGTPNSSIQIYPLPAWKMVVPSKYINKYGCMYSSLDDAGLTRENDVYRMQPSVQLDVLNKIKIYMTLSHQEQSAELKRVGIMFGTYVRQNPGEAELRLSGIDGSSFIQRFSLPDLADNQYRYFYLDSKNHMEGEIVSLSGGGISTWESHDEKGGIHTCIIYEYVDGKRKFTPGCPL